MEIQLIKGNYSASDALSLITNMIDIKVKFQENKIQHDSSEEEIKMREKRIKELQKQLYDVRKYIEAKGGNIEMKSDIIF